MKLQHLCFHALVVALLVSFFASSVAISQPIADSWLYLPIIQSPPPVPDVTAQAKLFLGCSNTGTPDATSDTFPAIIRGPYRILDLNIKFTNLVGSSAELVILQGGMVFPTPAIPITRSPETISNNFANNRQNDSRCDPLGKGVWGVHVFVDGVDKGTYTVEIK